MSGLSLNKIELNQIKSSWSKINPKEFYPELYENLFELNPQLRSIFNNDDSVINYHCDIFGDLFNFIINNIEDDLLLNEFLYQFVNENQRFSSMISQYLEPMGNALIQTFKNELSGQFTSVLELIWIKIFVFVANLLLQYEEDIVSEDSNSMDEDYYIPPLNINRERKQSIDTLPTPSPPLRKEEEEVKEEEEEIKEEEENIIPVVSPPIIGFDNSKPKQILDKFNSIEIDLNSNNKYKGFRRSIDVAKSPIHVPIPQSPSFQKIQSNMSSSLKNILISTDNDDNNNNNSNNSNFDCDFQTPRRRRKNLSFDPRRKNSSNPTTPKLDKSPFESPRLSAVANGKFASQQQKEHQGLEDVETDNEEFSTPRASRRGSFSENYLIGSLLNKLKKIQDPEEQEQEQEPVIVEDALSNKSEDSIDVGPFDPRIRRRRNEELNNKLIPSPESSEVDEQEEEEMFINKLSPPTSSNPTSTTTTTTTLKEQKQTVPERSLSRGGLTGGTFDYQSFGLKGLAPIVEDDDASSKYESDNDDDHDDEFNGNPVKNNNLISTKSSGQNSIEDVGEINSRTSSLSLNNSDYKSSISSGTNDIDHYTIKGAGVRYHSRNLSTTSSSGNDFEFSTPISKSRFNDSPKQQQQQQQQQHNNNKQSSLYSIGKIQSASVSSINSTSRASMGFMRSSFVLKKEMQTQGYNEPENVCLSMPVTPRMNNNNNNDNNKPSINSLSAPPAIYMNKAASISSFGRPTSISGGGVATSSTNSPKLNNSSGSTPYDSAYDLLNTFDTSLPPPPPLPIKDGIHNTLSRNSSISSQGSLKKKGGLRNRLSSIFSSKSSSSSSSSKLAESSSLSSLSNTPATSINSSSRKASIGSSSNTLVNSKPESQSGSNYTVSSHSTRQSVPLFSAQPSINHIPPIIKKVESSGIASSAASTRKPPSIYGHKYGSVNDLTSIYSTDTTTSGFSMFKRRDKNDVKFVPPLTRNTRKGNKYNVKKVPYDIWAT